MSVSNIGTSGRVVVSQESFKDKFTRRFKQEPLVPIGAFATTIALIVASVKLRRGDSKSMNNWLRVRVITQGLTIAAIAGGTYMYGNSKNQLEAKAADEAALNEEMEKQAFEERMKAAEEAHELEIAGAALVSAANDGKGTAGEKGNRALGWLGFGKGSAATDGSSSSAPSAPTSSAPTATATSNLVEPTSSSSSKGIWGWLGWKSSGSGSEPEKKD